MKKIILIVVAFVVVAFAIYAVTQASAKKNKAKTECTKKSKAECAKKKAECAKRSKAECAKKKAECTKSKNNAKKMAVVRRTSQNAQKRLKNNVLKQKINPKFFLIVLSLLKSKEGERLLSFFF